MLRRFAAAAIALVAVPAAHAQNLAAVCERALHPALGAWSEYRIVGGRQDGTTFRMAVVGKETHAGTAYLWIEVAARGLRMGSGGHDTLTMINKSLVPGLGPGMLQPRERIMKIGSMPAMEMPVQQARSGPTPGSDMLSRCRSAKVVGWERVTVPGGTFRAMHVQDAARHSDTWVDPDLPFAFVKGTSQGGGETSNDMVLIGHGMGAKSRITETPQPFDPKLFMRMLGGARPPSR